jgi:hypothetical protein
MGVQILCHAVGESIGGIDENEVEAGAIQRFRERRQPAPNLGPDQLGALAEAEPLDVAEGGPGVAVDEDGALGAARERLDRQGSGAL